MSAPASTRLETRFAQLREEKRGGLVIFVTAGDPSPGAFDVILQGLPDAGADVIEIGMPFSDPMADGPAIQLANLRALDAGMTLAKTLEAVKRFRTHNTTTPIVLMGYYNPIYRYGSERFITDAVSAGVDGLILVDLPPEEDNELCHPALTQGLHWVRLATPTTNDQRLPKVMANASGFVYYVSVAGITGTQSATQDSLTSAMARLRRATDLPIAIGFGIKTPQQVGEVTQVADAAVVGSAVVDIIGRATDEQPVPDNTTIAARVHEFVASLRQGVSQR